MRRAWRSVAGGVAGLSSIFQSGWNAVKCSGTSGPRCSITQRLKASTSAGESFSPGMSSVVISNQTSVSCSRYSSVSSTGPSRAERQHRRAGQEMVERLLLDRVDAEAGRAPVGREHHRVIMAGAHVAQPALAVMEPAIARAEIALDAAVLELVPIAARGAGKESIHPETTHVGWGLYSIYLGMAWQRSNANDNANARGTARGRGGLVLSRGSGAASGGGRRAPGRRARAFRRA